MLICRFIFANSQQKDLNCNQSPIWQQTHYNTSRGSRQMKIPKQIDTADIKKNNKVYPTD